MQRRNGMLIGFAALALFSALGLASCGPGGSNCGTCDFGTCDTDEGVCVNADTCNLSTDCLPGYECTRGGTCEPVSSCGENTSCETGVCQDGVCRNPDTCSENSDCLPKTYCDTSGEGEDGTCEPDPCNDVRCPRGTCERGVGRCVSKESCDPDTETFDCVSGQKCADGECVDTDDFCDELTCDRGTCKLEAGGCVNADECSNDQDCLKGHFCDETGNCQTDFCELQNIDCGEQGNCKPRTGKCENPTSCGTTEDCLKNHVCVNGTCRLESSACGNASGDGGCPGNQKCQYSEEDSEAKCTEPSTCETSVDCTGTRRCGGKTCLEPESCESDRFEENDKSGDAVAFVDASEQRTLRATLCRDDADFFKVDTTNLVDSSSQGTLLVEVDVPPRNRGLGKVELEVVDSDGNTLGTDTTGALGADGHARVTKKLMMSDHGTYTIRLQPGNSTNKTGVGYRLSADVLPSSTIKACGNADQISVNQRIAGSTKNNPSSALGSTCTKARNASSEKVFQIDVDRPQELTFELTPKSGEPKKEDQLDLAMSLRRHCTQRGSEVGCANVKGKGQKETMTTLVSPGTYYLIVQPPEGEKGGRFRLSVSRVYTRCAPRSDYCDSDGKAHDCAARGGQFHTLECDKGCNPARGRCVPPDGDICGTAKTIDQNNAQTRTVSLGQANNSYEVGQGSCLGSGDTKTEGPDVAYETKVPSRMGVRVEATFQNDVDGSLYIVGDCGKIDNTCQDAVKGSTGDTNREVLFYGNESMTNDETLYLIVDTDDGQDVTTADLDIQYKSIKCNPNSVSCGTSNTVEVCGPRGQNKTNLGSCKNTCTSGRCQDELRLSGNKFDSCSTALDVTALATQSNGIKISGNWSDFSNNVEGYVCGRGGPGSSITSLDSGGNETIFKMRLNAGQNLSASLSSSGDDPSVWLKTPMECGKTSRSTSCLAGDEDERGNASLSYSASSAETVYLHGDTEYATSGSFTYQLEIK